MVLWDATCLQEDAYANNACLDYLDDSLAARFAAVKLEAEPVVAPPQPNTPPREAATSATFAPVEQAVAAAVAAPVRRHKCMITRIEAFSSSHTLENCSWWVHVVGAGVLGGWHEHSHALQLQLEGGQGEGTVSYRGVGWRWWHAGHGRL